MNIPGLQTATSTITVSWVAELRGPFEDGTWRSSLPKCQVECCIQSWPNEVQNVKLQSSYMQLLHVLSQKKNEINSHCSLWNFAPNATKTLSKNIAKVSVGLFTADWFVHFQSFQKETSLQASQTVDILTHQAKESQVLVDSPNRNHSKLMDQWMNKMAMASQVSCLQLLSHMLLTH